MLAIATMDQGRGNRHSAAAIESGRHNLLEAAVPRRARGRPRYKKLAAAFVARVRKLAEGTGPEQPCSGCAGDVDGSQTKVQATRGLASGWLKE